MTSINIAPTLTWRNLTKAIVKKQPSLDSLSQKWLLGNDKGYWFSRSAWSIYSIIRLRMLYTNSESINVWLPDYFCNEATTALRELNVKLFFYCIDEYKKPDSEFCINLLKKSSPDLILYVNYFGENLFSKTLGDITKKSKAWLIEDSTHCLRPVDGIGSYGDFVIYSPYKFLSIPDGALMVIRHDGPSKVSDLMLNDLGFDGLYDSINNSKFSLKLNSLIWLIKRLIQKTGLHSFFKKNYINNDDLNSNSHKLPHPKMSLLARILLGTMVDLEAESKLRIRAQNQWSKSIEGNNRLNNKIVTEPNSGFTPYIAKVKLKDLSSFKDILQLFSKSKIPISTWPDLPPEVTNQPTIHKKAIKLRYSFLYLPVHGSISSLSINSKVRGI